MASASGLVVGVGEIFGGGIAPVLVGFAVSIYGIDKIFFMAMAALGIGFCVAMMLNETRPGRGPMKRDLGAGSTLSIKKL